MSRGGNPISKSSTVPKYTLGTKEEFANRGHVAYQSPGKPFTQIGTKPKGGNANEPSRASKSGDFKFSNGV